MKRAGLFAAVLVAVMLLTMSSAALGEDKGTDVYLRFEVQPSRQKLNQTEEMRREIFNRAQMRVARAQIMGVDIKMGDVPEILVKAKNVIDPEQFCRFIASPGKWAVVDENGQEIFPFKHVNKTLVDANGQVNGVAVFLSKPAAGAAAGAPDGTEIPVTIIWDETKYAGTARLANSGKSILLNGPEIDASLALQLKAIISLPPYPCPLKIIDFKYGDGILKSIFG